MTETKAEWERALDEWALGANEDGGYTSAQSQAFEAGWEAASKARAPVEPGVVTREHRDIALTIMWGSKGKSDAPGWLKAWVETGESARDADKHYAIAKAIADAEARGAAGAASPADPAVLGHIGSCMGCFFAELELLDALRTGAEAGEPAEKLLKRVTEVLRDTRRDNFAALYGEDRDVRGLHDASDAERERDELLGVSICLKEES